MAGCALSSCCTSIRLSRPSMPEASHSPSCAPARCSAAAGSIKLRRCDRALLGLVLLRSATLSFAERPPVSEDSQSSVSALPHHREPTLAQLLGLHRARGHGANDEEPELEHQHVPPAEHQDVLAEMSARSSSLQHHSSKLEKQRVKLLAAAKALQHERRLLNEEKAQLNKRQEEWKAKELLLENQTKARSAEEHMTSVLSKGTCAGLLQQAKQTHNENSRQHWDDLANLEGRIKELEEEILQREAAMPRARPSINAGQDQEQETPEAEVQESISSSALEMYGTKVPNEASSIPAKGLAEVDPAVPLPQDFHPSKEASSPQGPSSPLMDFEEYTEVSSSLETLRSKLKDLKASKAVVRGLIKKDEMRDMQLKEGAENLRLAALALSGEENLGPEHEIATAMELPKTKT